MVSPAGRQALGFEEAVQAYADTVTRLCCLHLKDLSEIEDVWQNVFLALFQRPDVLRRGCEAVKAWLIRVTLNKCADNNRRYKLHAPMPEELEAQLYMDSYPFELVDLLRNLPDKYAEPLYLYYFEGCSVKETARILKRTVSAVKTQLRRGREMLKGEMELEEF